MICFRYVSDVYDMCAIRLRYVCDMFMICVRYVYDRNIVHISQTYISHIRTMRDLTRRRVHSIAYICICYSLLMRNASRSKPFGSGSTKRKGGGNKQAHKSDPSDGRSEAQKKADTKYYEACIVFCHFFSTLI
jgi:hypothetical protein